MARVVVVYLRRGDTASINLWGLGTDGVEMSVHWYDPRNGGDLKVGFVVTIGFGRAVVRESAI